jgi:hypothetical protein
VNESTWEAIARSATWIRDEIDGPFGGSFRGGGVCGELEVILEYLVCCRPDDLPARAVTALPAAWLAAVAAEERIEFWARLGDDVEDADAGRAA